MKHNSFGKQAARYFLNLKTPPLPSPFTVLNPYGAKEVNLLIKTFFQKFYEDAFPRIYIFGINPGRFGGGITGVPFTDPVALKVFCGIDNSFPQKRELSSTFIYQLVDKLGGPAVFFARYFLTALFPLALIENGKNLNYYDSPELCSALWEYISGNVENQSRFGAAGTAVSLGIKNGHYLRRLNSTLKIFKEILVFEHPRFIMQYRRKQLQDYLDRYSTILAGLGTS